LTSNIDQANLNQLLIIGLTPSQIFEAPHPARAKQPKHALEPKSMITASTCSALIQSIVPIRDIRQPIGEIHPGMNLEKTFVSGPQSLLVPPNATHRLDWDFLDQTLRIFDSTNSLCATFEGVSSEHISSACFADQRTLATGSTDSTISLWRFAWLANGGAHLQQIEVLRGHSGPITCIVASRTLSIVVSGAEDGLAMIWDLNRALLVHSLPHSNPVSFAAIVSDDHHLKHTYPVLIVAPDASCDFQERIHWGYRDLFTEYGTSLEHQW
jgi:WD40 repeat protein